MQSRVEADYLFDCRIFKKETVDVIALLVFHTYEYVNITLVKVSKDIS